MPTFSDSSEHTHFMSQALKLARMSTRRVLPNPSVGAVIVHNGTIIGSGYHRFYGGPHAEIEALQSVSDHELLSQSTLYVTLEPCAHFGKTPPCTDAIIQAKIPRVVVGCGDPFEHVKGRGLATLRAAGVAVVENCLAKECTELNKRFILAHKLHRPYVILKWAQTADGFIAPPDRSKLQISGPEAHSFVHLWRGQEMAIAVGSTTVKTDNPRLTVRDTARYLSHELPPLHPLRVILGDTKEFSPRCKVFSSEAPTLIFSSASLEVPEHITVMPTTKQAALLPVAMNELYKKNILSLFVEGGRHTLEQFITHDLWDEARVCFAPHTIGTGVPAPQLPVDFYDSLPAGVDTFYLYRNPSREKNLGISEY
jgi:diaminohydroxyphosphoribosylaminopyrimidine deaminase/5-amino-6-(5-phosphoribosylamino)uracil reductase